jgi:hypothetical protein
MELRKFLKELAKFFKEFDGNGEKKAGGIAECGFRNAKGGLNSRLRLSIINHH